MLPSTRCAAVLLCAGLVTGWGLPSTRAAAPKPSPRNAAIRAMPPETPKRPVQDEYHGVTVTDDYRWLEDWDNSQVKKWSDDQNTRARDFLDHLPHVAA